MEQYNGSTASPRRAGRRADPNNRRAEHLSIEERDPKSSNGHVLRGRLQWFEEWSLL